jgi:hypothetical protein
MKCARLGAPPRTTSLPHEVVDCIAETTLTGGFKNSLGGGEPRTATEEKHWCPSMSLFAYPYFSLLPRTERSGPRTTNAPGTGENRERTPQEVCEYDPDGKANRSNGRGRLPSRRV